VNGASIREAFLEYFADRGHEIVPSSSAVPQADATLLFTNAGMVQFKDVFRGVESRPYRRAVTAQKVVRAGGKHNDLDNVGRTARHQTFFEMLGNFSFGDYFKEEAIRFAWELLTRVYRLDPVTLSATVHYQDEEAVALWRSVAGLPPERIVRLGDKDNFWSMGDTGPCGPCSEIVVDRGPERRCDAPECAIGKCDCDRWLEVWNLVFMQFDRDSAGAMTPLPRPSIDTGMGLERLATVLQRVDTNYETDLLRPIVDEVARISGVAYERGDGGFAHRVIADHSRSIAFLIADGVLPGNEGRGYVLRRILRRASRIGRHIGLIEPFLARTAGIVVEQMGEAYPELRSRRDFVASAIETEEARFGRTLETGLTLLTDLIARAKTIGVTELNGAEVFRLYDTYGFPRELTEEVAAESGFTVDLSGFDREMARQRATARAASRFAADASSDAAALAALELPATEFLGYEDLTADSVIVAIVRDGIAVDGLTEGEEGEVICPATPFYAEAGGQVGDTGTILSPGGRGEVRDTRRLIPGVIVHRVRVVEGSLGPGAQVVLRVDADRRAVIIAHHTATHLLHRALRDTLGTHVHQAGSLVAPERLRFDFTHTGPLSVDERDRVEIAVNEAIRANLTRTVTLTTYDEAVRQGAMALFGEKYGEVVRMVAFGDHSRELCGGTHVAATGEIGHVLLLTETSVASGVRRVEMVAAGAADAHVRRERERWERLARTVRSADVLGRVEALVREIDDLRRDIERARRENAVSSVDRILAAAQSVDGLKVVGARADGDAVAMRALGDLLRGRLGPSVVALGGIADGKATIVVLSSAQTRVHAGRIAEKLGAAVGGRGGGRPDNGQAGGPNVDGLEEALGKVPEIVRSQLVS